MSDTYKGILKTEYQELLQTKKKAILELLKGVNFEQIRDILELVSNEVEEIKSQSILQ
ncbi:putative house-cleaning noncanonical NTP pyrophosphatase (MazG superfamily) [Flavobacterium sp. CG_23.5]|jgi:predicted house-cleaning noncanonical NTP pyrophosphatase (MazG superfamily)|uniref:hypothetical protein n=1 Tax=Flavobacterium sp. CG_23.5 TaxID=2760708 RepID=UPI001AE63D0A|nr:hypothetical protein [Flavobacterium sp. CG_23.5]MBP2282966.1 putative house-cleaning noncanonical NTP pyrophosphatase (MazG superfamily) [Flavobacterium sp. CG_23.5]